MVDPHANLVWMRSLHLRRTALSAVRRVPALNGSLPWGIWSDLWLHSSLDASSIVRRLRDRHREPLVFVQIGSNDGKLSDPIYETVIERHWTGLLVEPLPHLFDQLRANYHGVSGLAFEQIAIGEASGPMTLYRLTPRDGDPFFADALATFDRSIIAYHRPAIPDIEDRIEAVEVPAMSLMDLIQKHGLTRIDILNTDTEGFDWQIIRQIDFSASWAPRYILFESKHLNAGTAVESRRVLTAAGYRLLDAGSDTFAYRF